MNNTALTMEFILARSYREDIEFLIKKNQVAEAFDRLQDFVRDLAPHLRNQTISLCGRHARYTQDFRLGIAQRDELIPIIGGLLEMSSEAFKMATMPTAFADTGHAMTATKQQDNCPPSFPLILVDMPIEQGVCEQRERITSPATATKTQENTTPTLTLPPTPPASHTAESANDDQPGSGDLSLTRLRQQYFRQFRKTTPPDKTTAVICRDVAKAYAKGQFRLEPLSLDLRVGEITGVVGRNASGKTTLLNLLLGQMKPDEGDITYPSLTRSDKSWSNIKQQIAYIPQTLDKWGGTLRTNLNFVAAAHGLYGRDNAETIDWHLHRYGMKPYEKFRWEELTGGLRMRFELIRVLVSRPKLLVLDEPLAHLDVIARQEFLGYLQTISMSFENPIPIILTSQHIYEIETISDRMIIFDNGQCKFSGDIAGIGKLVGHTMFEVNVDCTQSQLRAALPSPPLQSVEEILDGYLLGFDKSVPPVQIAEMLLRAFGERLNGWRNISKSARSLMQSDQSQQAAGTEK